MDRAYKFIEDAREEALALMGKGMRSLKPHEIDLIVAICDAHKGVCEFIELEEKFGDKPDVSVGAMWQSNPRRRRM